MRRVIGIYLAAGKSSRMGTDKLRLSIGDTTLGSLALYAALQSQLERVVVVTRDEGVPSWADSLLLAEVLRSKTRYVQCANADLGQAASLGTGLQTARIYSPDAIMILLADQPFVTVHMLNELICCYDSSPRSYVAASYRGVKQPPVIIGKEWFDELVELSGDEGARKLLRRDESGLALEYSDPLLFYDVDTEQQYAALLQNNEGDQVIFLPNDRQG